MRCIVTGVVAATALIAVSGSTHMSGQVPEAPLRMTAFAVNMSNIGGAGAQTVDIVIDRWSTDAEREQLVSSFVEKGPEALLNALQRMNRVGYIRFPNTIGYDLQFARKHRLDEGGAQIIVATDRPIGFAEARNQPRTIDYPFTLIDIRLNARGEGEGKMSVATKITFNKKKNEVELENYASEPVRLQNIRTEAKK